MAEIAQTTRDPATGQRSMALVRRSLIEAEWLPDEEGRDEPPGHLLSESARKAP